MRYEVRQYTLCDGWVNTWSDDKGPMTFATVEEAQAEIDEFLADIQADIDAGDREPEDGYSADEFMIAPVDEPSNESADHA